MTVALVLIAVLCLGLLLALKGLHSANARLVAEQKKRDHLAQQVFGPMLARFSHLTGIEGEIQRVKEAFAQTRQDDEGARATLTRENADALEKLAQGLLKAQQEHTDRLANLPRDYREKSADLEREYQGKRYDLEKQYQGALVTYNALKAEVASLEESLEDMSFGLYNPHFTFHSSEEYKNALDALRDKQRELIRRDQAAHCPHNWVVGNSRVEGERMVRLYKKVLLRAFNGECDAAISNATWSNFEKMQERIKKSFAGINDCGSITRISITQAYLETKLDELRLTHEYEAKRWDEKEALRIAREEKREELRAAQEIEQAQEEAEQQEMTYEKLLEIARKEAAEATGAQLRELIEKVATFEAKLDEARKKKEKAISRAQLTKSGFVYVISNIGAFGENVFKIGMTRRMEPMERISELSGAAVPFPFDLHAMLYSDNAPELECALHNHFDERRLNLINARKEFYRDVQLAEVREFVTQRGLSAQFIATPEARQYRETQARREQKLVAVPNVVLAEPFSRELFA
jgi:Domain of unknown function (DUF4041)/T5orf172 domain